MLSATTLPNKPPPLSLTLTFDKKSMYQLLLHFSNHGSVIVRSIDHLSSFVAGMDDIIFATIAAKYLPQV